MRPVGIDRKVVDVVIYHIQMSEMDSCCESGAKHEWIGEAMPVPCAISSHAQYATK